jgi:hypothetical protein
VQKINKKLISQTNASMSSSNNQNDISSTAAIIPNGRKSTSISKRAAHINARKDSKDSAQMNSHQKTKSKSKNLHPSTQAHTSSGSIPVGTTSSATNLNLIKNHEYQST